MASRKSLPGEAYARAVVAGKTVAGRLVKLACKRHLADLKRYGTQPGKAYYYFDAAAAARPTEFARRFCHHSKGEWAGQPVVFSPWQEFIAAAIFGWKRRDGLRRFRVTYLEVARKNGKSTFLAVLGLYLLVADGEPGAEIYTAATKRDQARIIHDESVKMRAKSPALARRIQHYRSTHNLSVAKTDSKYEPLGADEDSLDGLNPSGLLIDELHAHKNRSVYDVLDTATGARSQPLLIVITTAGFNKQSVCWEEHDFGARVLEGHVEDDTRFVFIASLDEGDDWRDEANWPKANPNLGISVKADDLRRKAAKAKLVPAAQNAFRRLHLDEWTEQSERWMDLAAWDACGGEVDPDALVGRPCYAGLDLADNRDIAGAVLFFPPEDDEPAAVLAMFWIPEENVGERVRAGVPYDVWIEEGHIATTPGDVIDQDFIRSQLNEQKDSYEILEVAYDPWGAVKIAVELQGDGFTMVPFRQHLAAMAPATQELERLILAKGIAHAGNPVLRWMVGNAAVRQGPDGARKPDKKLSREKIDGVVCLVMAIGRATLKTTTKSVYNDRDPLELEL